MMNESLAASSLRAKVSQRLWLTSLSSSYDNLQAQYIQLGLTKLNPKERRQHKLLSFFRVMSCQAAKDLLEILGRGTDTQTAAP